MGKKDNRPFGEGEVEEVESKEVQSKEEKGEAAKAEAEFKQRRANWGKQDKTPRPPKSDGPTIAEQLALQRKTKARLAKEADKKSKKKD